MVGVKRFMRFFVRIKKSRAVSPVVATILVIGIVLSTTAMVYMWGVPYLEDKKVHSETEAMYSQLKILDDTLSDLIHEGVGASRENKITMNAGSLSIKNQSEQMVLLYSMEDGYNFSVSGLNDHDKTFTLDVSERPDERIDLAEIYWLGVPDPVMYIPVSETISLYDDNGNEYGVLRFNISGIPSNVVIDDVYLKLYVLEQSKNWDGDICFSDVDEQTWDDLHGGKQVYKFSKVDTVFQQGFIVESVPSWVQSTVVDKIVLNDYLDSRSFCSIKISDPSYKEKEVFYKNSGINSFIIGNPSYDDFLKFAINGEFKPVMVVHYHSPSNQFVKNQSSYSFFDNEKTLVGSRKDAKDSSVALEEEPLGVNNGVYKKTVKITSGHRYNVVVNTTIPEVRYKNQINLKQLSHKTGINVKDFKIKDTNGNGLWDTIEWTVPRLSEKNYEINIDFNKVNYTSEFSETINHYNGSFTGVFHAHAANYYDKKEQRFKPINTLITPSHIQGYGYENTKNIFQSYFKDQKPGMKLLYQNYSYQVQLLNNRKTNSMVEGCNITYSDVYQGVDLRYIVGNTGTHECFILKQFVNVSRFIQVMQLSGLKPLVRDGGVCLKNMGNETVFVLKTPVMYEQGNMSRRCYDIRYRVIKLNPTTYLLVKEIGEQGQRWLRDRSRVFPVVVDPTLSVYSSSSDGYVENQDNNWANCHDATSGDTADDSSDYVTALLADNNDPTYIIKRLFFYFDTSSLPDTGITITGATFTFYIGDRWGGVNYVIQKGTQGSPLSTGDFDAFSGSYYGSIVAAGVGYNEIDWDTGLGDISKTGTTKICFRDWDYDYNNSIPPIFQPAVGNIYFSDYTGTSQDPMLNVTYITADTDPPTSSVDTITPYLQSSSPLTISATADDGSGSGVKNVTLYY
ncbi:MAG: hypothetical protein DRM98_05010, partial [Thermoplasmata archaeon]